MSQRIPQADKLNPNATFPERFFAALQAAGMPKVPEDLSVVPQHQVIPSAMAGWLFQHITTTAVTRAET